MVLLTRGRCSVTVPDVKRCHVGDGLVGKHTMRFMLLQTRCELAVPCIAPANNTTNIVPVRPHASTLSPALQ